MRLLLKDRGYSVTAVLTLAICIGANVALFSVVHNILLRPLPVPEPDRILLMSNQYPRAGSDDSSNSGVPDYYDRLRETSVYTEQAVFNHSSLAMGQEGEPVRVRVANATPEAQFNTDGIQFINVISDDGGKGIAQGLQAFMNAEKQILAADNAAMQLANTGTLAGLTKHLDHACVGSINEIFDAEEPYTPRGCIAQAWSVAEALRCWVKTAAA